MQTKFLGLILSILCCSYLGVHASTDTMFTSTRVTTKVLCINIVEGKTKLNNFLQQNKVIISDMSEDKSYQETDFSIDSAGFRKYQALLTELGFVISNKLNTENNAQRVRELQLEIKFLEEKRDSYNTLLQQLTNQNDTYYKFWNEIKSIEEKIFDKRFSLLKYQKKDNLFYINITIQEEMTTPDENRRIKFVNMPGAEYSFFRVEVPQKGLSAPYYHGISLKYLFTKGKSYAVVGAYKCNTSTSDTARFAELFTFGFGQDFYSRRLGRGANRFFNLYSGYLVGASIASNEHTMNTLLFVAPSVGVELLKTKYILIDTKISYYIPFKFNKNMRGLQINTAVNFVF